jgi:hypothetical protein
MRPLAAILAEQRAEWSPEADPEAEFRQRIRQKVHHGELWAAGTDGEQLAFPLAGTAVQ